MAILTQGTEIYVLAPKSGTPGAFEVLKVACPTAFNPGEESADDIDVTCLDVRDVRSMMAGLTTPGEASMTINTDPSMASHVRLYEIKSSKEVLRWAIGWSDNFGVPPLAGGVGTVASIAVTAGGSDYDAGTTTVTITGGGGGSGATATPVIVGGVITAINITNPGTGYDSTPTITISDSGSGTGATATATLGTGDPGTFTLPSSRTWLEFQGTLATFPFAFETNSVVQSAMTIKRSGALIWTPKA